MAMVLRSLYLDPQLDIDLGNRAEFEGVTKAELMRRFLVEGLQTPAPQYAAYAKTDAQRAKPAAAPPKRADKKPAGKPQPARRVASSKR